jgi:hypothetical protein
MILALKTVAGFTAALYISQHREIPDEQLKPLQKKNGMRVIGQ